MRRASLEVHANAPLVEMADRLAESHLAWRQELPITAALDADNALAQMERGGSGGAGVWLAALAASMIATAAALALALRCWKWPRLEKQDAPTIAALHAEKVNRTRHIRAALASRSPDDTQVLIVGRPHMSLAATRSMLEESHWKGGFALAWGLGSLLRSLPRGLAVCWRAPAAIRVARYNPGTKQLAAIMLRILIGLASAAHWTSGDRSARRAIFGHTGRADTVLLEAAMQEGGVRTAHWMHGLSTGVNFAGISNLCVTQCEHDARWHDELLEYGRNVAFPVARPRFRQGEKPGWVVMTNMTHPVYPYFPIVGPAHELRLVDLVAELAQRAGIDPASVTWKPHPVFYQQDSETRAVVSHRLAQAGFTLWPEAAMPFDFAAAHETVIVTPSGVALDVLKAGRLPVMAAFHPPDPGHALAQVKPVGSDLASLEKAIELARDPAQARLLFEQVWDAIGPGEIGTLERIEVELSR